MASGKHKKANRPKQDGYEIALDSGNDTVKQTWVRFGTLDPRSYNNPEKIYMWASTIDMGPVNINPRQTKIIATVDDDQLPALANLPALADPCYYQVMCEINNEDGHPEILMIEPTLLA